MYWTFSQVLYAVITGYSISVLKQDWERRIVLQAASENALKNPHGRAESMRTRKLIEENNSLRYQIQARQSSQ